MPLKITFFFILFFCLFWNSYAHDFNEETMKYILSNPESTWSDFESHISSFEDEELEEKLQNINSKLATILSMPGKKYVTTYANANKDFSYSDIEELIVDDPMLWEIGPEIIYSFLSEKLQWRSAYSISLDYFFRFIYLWIEHILSWIDHILFIFTLIITLPKSKRIFAIITTFTIAHSITIILWGFQIITLPSIIVESMIIFSIWLMALYSLFQKIWKSQKFIPEFILIFTLWIFHGLGFAWFFSEILQTNSNIVLPVIWFNIGVEFWQIVIIWISLLWLHTIYKTFAKQKEYIKNTLAACLVCASTFWLIQMLVLQ